jgi:hypothetical protein
MMRKYFEFVVKPRAHSFIIRDFESLYIARRYYSQNRSPLIWFQLVDSSGRPYKGTSADKVKLDSSADIADFKKAVKAKYDQPGFLKDISSGVLLVYRDKDAFDKRNASVKVSHALLDDR